MPFAPRLCLNSAGYFCRDGERLIPVGVNYWPASCGVEMWQRWPEEEIQHDLDVVVGLGLNSVRFFLRWQDFEPDPGAYDEAALARLEQFLSWCRDRGLLAQPSLFVGWMSGGTFWPRWKGERNAFADPDMVERAASYAGRIAEVVAPYDACLLGLDQGNELCCLTDSREAPPDAVVAWCRQVNEAIRGAYPGCVIISGNEQNQIVSDTGWRLGNQPGTDLYSMHAYPVPTWHSVPFDGMTDPLCQSLLPLYTKIARAFGPVMVQEFGTIATFGRRQQDSYLRAMLPAAWEAGANGFLWWCLRDIHARVHPYVKNNFESTLGLVDAEDRVKPGLEYYVEFTTSLRDRPAPDRRGNVALYLPKHYYPRDNQENPGNDPRQLSRWLVMANYLLQRLGYRVEIVRGDLVRSDRPIATEISTIVVPGALLCADEADALDAWVRRGGHLVWHGPDPVNWGWAYVRLLGARPVDYRAARQVKVALGGDVWEVNAFPRNARIELEPDGAEVLARDDTGLPAVLRHAAGRGRVTYATGVIEESAAAVAGDRQRRDRWQRWYAAMLS